LRALGHRVCTPTLTGLGERAHLRRPDTDLDTHVNDTLGHIVAEDLWDVILVGHSYAGVVISHVADRLRPRLRRLVYLDAQIAVDGTSIMDALAPDIRAQRRGAAIEGGTAMAAPTPDMFGISDPDFAAWVAPRLRPHPIGTYEQVGHLSQPVGNGLPCDFVLCTDPPFASIKPFAEQARGLGWPVHELATGHDAMLTAPGPTADLFLQIASQ